ncbi:MAG: glycine C-acetyltransferase [Candidatus Fischerbacteria bacterium RBG_13_37_8]|uniref:2-amino-3-ketobutyrate coenzyme A ligase n=1 Tax=Candidatus Fischerbacteria bacterium RBG_13_37_8 TaxID=1817863 RepID=A0A1F5VXL7_9BACT|nr:MAG: glycine C-acetyltransferase [Candidatus Fischerbacteria bacterium RBG_13_37_8]
MVYSDKAKSYFGETLNQIQSQGLFKEERFICSPQAASIDVEYPQGAPQKKVLNFCANNYLGLSSHPEVVQAAREGLDTRGYGLSSVRFICGTQDIHRTLEQKLSEFLGTEDTILFASCMDANAGVFDVVLDKEDAMIADRLVHASIVDGMRLCKAQLFNYKHSNMAHLEEKLRESQECRFRLIITDGVFSMDGDIAKLDEICNLAEKYDAMVLVDDSHSTGFMGKHGRGTHEHCGVLGRIDLITTTLGKALGGASGGCVSGRKELVELCRQRARPYLFSNTIPPVIVAAAIKVIELISKTTDRRDKLEANTLYFRKEMTQRGFDIREGVHPIAPIMLYNAKLAQDMARDLYAEGIYVIGFAFPVVPQGQARIRVQLSAAHEREDIDKAIAAFTKIGQKYNILGKKKDEIIKLYGL